MKTRILGGIAGAALGVLLFASSALAIVSLDADGNGFIGKGDVQTAFGWNNATMQKRHQDIKFEARNSADVEQDCKSGTGQNMTVSGERTGSKGLNAALASDSRKTGQYTGWNASGNTLSAGLNETITWNRPTGTGTGCPDGSTPQGAVRTVAGTESSGIYAVYGADARKIAELPS